MRLAARIQRRRDGIDRRLDRAAGKREDERAPVESVETRRCDRDDGGHDVRDERERHRAAVADAVDDQAEEDDGQRLREQPRALNRTVLGLREIEGHAPLGEQKCAHDETERHGDQRDDARHEEAGRPERGIGGRCGGVHGDFRMLRRNFTPFQAISSRVGSILRQIAAARARTFHVGGERLDDHVAIVANCAQRRGDRLPVDVIVARRAAVAAAGVEVAEVRPALRIAAAGSFSSMFMWKVSRCSFSAGLPTS